MPQTTNSTPKRRWFRFSVRTLLIVVVLLSLPLGWFAWKMRQAERQRQAVEAIKEAGGWVRYDFELPNHSHAIPGFVVRLVGNDFSSHVVEVTLPTHQCGDQDLEHLKGLTQLRGLAICSTQVTDAGLGNLKGLTVVHLVLRGSQVTEEGVRQLEDALPGCQIAWDRPPPNKPQDPP